MLGIVDICSSARGLNFSTNELLLDVSGSQFTTGEQLPVKSETEGKRELHYSFRVMYKNIFLAYDS